MELNAFSWNTCTEWPKHDMHDTVIVRDEMYYMYIRQKSIQTICRIMELNAFFEIITEIWVMPGKLHFAEGQLKSSHIAPGQNPVSI